MQTGTTLKERQDKAEGLLDIFSQYTGYKHRAKNPYLNWLKSNPELSHKAVIDFFNFWYPVSKHQPQILLLIAAAYPDWRDRELIMRNYWEEDGMAKPGDEPHYVLLEKLIIKLKGKLNPDPLAEELTKKFHSTLNGMTSAQATGYVAAIEHPALDISDYFRKIIDIRGYSGLITTDPYLYIHVDVEPDHIIWSHGNALEHMKIAEEKDEILNAYQSAMSFWEGFWALAFSRLNYPGPTD